MSGELRFAIYSGSELIGWSALELGDAPMGVAFGLFVPAAGYASIESQVVKAGGGPLSAELQLSAQDRNGTALQASGGVHLIDVSKDAGSEGREVSVLGIPYPSYELLFPEHVAAYDTQFAAGDRSN